MKKQQAWVTPWRIYQPTLSADVFEVFWASEEPNSYAYAAVTNRRTNARLIATAPEMLAVLVAARTSISDALRPGFRSTDWRDGLSEALAVIDATIDDATKEEV
tara:strand:+ start:8017 stop:8328 length:312 start_codon:yes stop_codon:yes gene_type:complete